MKFRVHVTGKVWDEIAVEADSAYIAEKEAEEVFRSRAEGHFDEIETDVEEVR